MGIKSEFSGVMSKKGKGEGMGPQFAVTLKFLKFSDVMCLLGPVMKRR